MNDAVKAAEIFIARGIDRRSPSWELVADIMAAQEIMRALLNLIAATPDVIATAQIPGQLAFIEDDELEQPESVQPIPEPTKVVDLMAALEASLAAAKAKRVQS